MDVKYTSWDHVPIKVYKEISRVLAEEGTPMEKDVRIYAILCDVSEEDIWNLTLPEIGALKAKVQWVYDFDFKKDVKYRKVNIGKYRCTITDNMGDFSVGQYMDFNNYWDAKDRDISMLLTTFLVPEGKKYNTDYDILDLRDEIELNLSITEANSLCFFFLRSLWDSMRATLLYLDYITSKMEKRMTPEARARMEEMRRTLQRATASMFGSH